VDLLSSSQPQSRQANQGCLDCFARRNFFPGRVGIMDQHTYEHTQTHSSAGVPAAHAPLSWIGSSAGTKIALQALRDDPNGRFVGRDRGPHTCSLPPSGWALRPVAANPRVSPLVSLRALWLVCVLDAVPPRRQCVSWSCGSGQIYGVIPSLVVF
jgi:hypothetical protein